VTLRGIKRPGRHDPLVDRATFDRVQAVLDGHRASGDRSYKHHHYLSGSIFCGVCEKRLGYGRHRGNNGGIYEYFSCLSRITKEGRCSAQYTRVDAVEEAIEREHEKIALSQFEQGLVREAIRRAVGPKVKLALREAERHARRLSELNTQQQKLVQLYYRDAVSLEVLRAEQQRIDAERAEVERWQAAAATEADDVTAALDEALLLADADTTPYAICDPAGRRLINQGLFVKLLVMTADTVEATLTPLYAELTALARGTTRPRRRDREVAANRPKRTKKNQDPGFSEPWFALRQYGGEGGIRTRDGV
jgi:site-specific DNA recombinase